MGPNAGPTGASIFLVWGVPVRPWAGRLIKIGAQNPHLVGSQAPRTALDPGLVRLGRLGAVMATRVQNVQNGPKNCGAGTAPGGFSR